MMVSLVKGVTTAFRMRGDATGTCPVRIGQYRDEHKDRVRADDESAELLGLSQGNPDGSEGLAETGPGTGPAPPVRKNSCRCPSHVLQSCGLRAFGQGRMLGARTIA